MNSRIHPLLLDLYGATAAASAVQHLTILQEQWSLRWPNRWPSRDANSLTQRDVLLITYPDQVSEPGRTPLEVLCEFCEAHLRGVVTGLHLLPFYPSSSDDGFAVKDYFAVDPALGSWEDVARLGQSFDLMFDAVFNHASAQGDWFQRFLRGDPELHDFFVTVEGTPDLSRVIRPRALPLLTSFETAHGIRRVWTTFGPDQVDLNYQNPALLLAVLAALLFYVNQGARFIRLDAIGFLWKEPGTSCLHLPQTHRIIQLFRAVLDEVAPHVLLITETNVPHAENLGYFGDGQNEAQLVYNFALPPLVLHTLQTGDARALTRWAQSLEPPSDQVTFLNFLASHDGVGLNPVRGILGDAEVDAMVRRTWERGGLISYKDMPDGSRLPYEMNINYLDALSPPAPQEPTERAARRFLTAHAILLSLQGVPAIYFHSMFGSRGDRVGADTSGIPRRINREKLSRARLETELNQAHSLRDDVWRGLRRLLHIRASTSAFHPQAAQRILTADPRLFAVCRTPPQKNECVLCLHNVSTDPVLVSGCLSEVMSVLAWTDLLTGKRYEPGGPPLEIDGYQNMVLMATA
jgi:sucrose phosphorylase